nr:FliI/YscN family ATPase [Ruficoccus amylovorans]
MNFDRLRHRLRQAETVAHAGAVSEVRGLIIEAHGPQASLGGLCHLLSDTGEEPVLAEVVGFRENRMLLMPLGELRSIGPGCKVVPAPHAEAVPVGKSVLGRVIDGMGRALDAGPPLDYDYSLPLRRPPPDPLSRRPIERVFATGVRALDCFTPVGVGQRLGLFAGSGVGKSTLLGMLMQSGAADVNVVALIGERGREVREFIEHCLTPEARARSVIVVSTSDQPAMVRLRAAYLATGIAEWFRDRGSNVLFLMDSVTRFAMAQREIGLSVGEAPATRGYPPSVFSLLPRLLERTGNAAEGTITAFYTVLVDGDDMNEPIADAVRGILDGHVVLSRAIASANRYPAVDVLESVSRLTTRVCSEKELTLMARARNLLSLYRSHEDLINIGAYVAGSNPRVDEAIAKREALEEFLRQAVHEKGDRMEAFKKMAEVLA